MTQGHNTSIAKDQDVLDALFLCNSVCLTFINGINVKMKTDLIDKKCRPLLLFMVCSSRDSYLYHDDHGGGQ